MNKDEMKIKGSLNVVIHHANGDVETRHKDNLILNGGFDYICAAMANPTRPDVMGYTAVVTGTTAVDADAHRLWLALENTL